MKNKSNLLPHQLIDRRYAIYVNTEGQEQLTFFQTIFLTNMINSRIGDLKIARRIWQYGIPELMSPIPYTFGDLTMLADSMERCLQWLAALANDLWPQEAHPVLQSIATLLHELLGSAAPEKRQVQCRQSLLQARSRLACGELLAALRDSKKRSYSEMSAEDQVDTGIIQTCRVRRVSAF